MIIPVCLSIKKMNRGKYFAGILTRLDISANKKRAFLDNSK
jgi:hypothetical protein